MPVFFKLPSGTIVDLASIEGFVPATDGSATLHFDKGDSLLLAPQDAASLERKLSKAKINDGPQTSSILKVAVFWMFIILIVLLAYLTVRSPVHRG